MNSFLKNIFVCCSFIAIFSCNEGTSEGNLSKNWSPSRSELSSMKNIEEIDLSEGNYNGISKKIIKFRELKILNLRSNQLNKLPPYITELRNLIKINLAKNQFAEFPEQILQLEQIQEIDLRYNKLKRIPVGIKSLKNLHTLYLGGNEIDSAHKSELRDWLPKTKLIFGAN